MEACEHLYTHRSRCGTMCTEDQQEEERKRKGRGREDGGGE